MSTLKKIKELEDSISGPQLADIKEALGKRLWTSLNSALDSSTEEEAEERIAIFVAMAKRNVIKVMKVRNVLDDRQKDIILYLMDDDG